MAIINPIDEKLHRIRVKLYPNYLPGDTQGKYIARTDDEASLTVEDVCAAAKNRGGYTGSYEDLVEHVKIYFDEAAYQLADGFSVNTGWYSIHPKVGGTFERVENIDPKNHKIDFSFRVRGRLRDLASKIELIVEGIADTQGYIDQVLDVSTGSLDDALTPGGMITVSGHKIKIEGNRTGVGMFLVGQAGAQPVLFAPPYAENSSSKIITLIPATVSPGTYHLEIVTQYTHGSGTLKEPRTIRYPADLTVS